MSLDSHHRGPTTDFADLSAEQLNTSAEEAEAATIFADVARDARIITAGRLHVRELEPPSTTADPSGRSRPPPTPLTLLQAELCCQQRDPVSGRLRKYRSTESCLAARTADDQQPWTLQPLPALDAPPAPSTEALQYQCLHAPYLLRFYNVESTPGPKTGPATVEQRIEVWLVHRNAHDDDHVQVASSARLLRTLATDRAHGDVYSDLVFSGCCFSPPLNVFIYVAEKRRPTVRNWWTAAPGHTAPASAADADHRIGSEYVAHEDYGEQYADKRQPRLFVLDVSGGGPQQWRVYPLRITAAADDDDDDDDDRHWSGHQFDWAVTDAAEPQCHGHRLAWVVRAKRNDISRGLVYCSNRPSYLALGTLRREAAAAATSSAADAVVLRVDGVLDGGERDGSWGVSCPRFGPDGSLLWVSARATPQHSAAHTVRQAHFDRDANTDQHQQRGDGWRRRTTIRTLLGMDVHLRPALHRWPGGFYPVCVPRALPDSPSLFLNDDHDEVVFQAVVGSRACALVLNLRTARVYYLGYYDRQRQLRRVSSVLDCGRSPGKRTWLLGVEAELCRPPQAWVGVLGTAELPGTDGDWGVRVLDAYQNVTIASPSTTPSASTHCFSLSMAADGRIDDADNPPDRYEAMVAVPPTSPLCSAHGAVPLVLMPHGGPHAGFVANAYLFGVDLLTRAGFAVLLVNYRGSTGQGEARLADLLGRIGELDVQECLLAVHTILRDDALAQRLWAGRDAAPRGVDGQRISVVGGSHGGFLAAHLSSQYPDLFRAAVLRNPVVNIASMVTLTDIVDWCYAECGLEVPGSKSSDASTTAPLPTNAHPNVHRAPDATELSRMLQHSPIPYAHRVRAATLLQIGGADLRVPPAQGFEWARAVRPTASAVRTLRYPQSNHPIEDSPSFDDAWVQCVAWLLRFGARTATPEQSPMSATEPQEQR
ncbi:hypothetical protein CDCA_CDCA02G0507 [Cyanidium caldarium]|uniref:acylaminoacyl-peptidase n=1 Tax=Cyanidium caldarium TaxID=2771 RepID=A0AAV9IQD5_CYACA|nr:hypothetical protein CDCA_CDCA02G0507 [Cyanidium caldarium]